MEDIQLTPTARVADHANNLDADDTNDAYLMDVSFKPAIEIAENNDDSLVMYIYDSNDNLIATGRIAGTLQDGEIQLKDNGQGYYTFEDVLMIEGEENIRFQLDGTQHLARGAYLLTSENRDGETSQTMVAVAEGDRDVCVEMRISFDLDVRDERLATCHMWRTEAIVPPTGDRNYLQWILAAITMVLAAAVLYKTRRNAA